MQQAGAASGVISAIGGLVEGTGYLAQGRYNSRVAERNALYAERDAAAAAERAREESRAGIGGQAAAQAGSGFETGTGTALDALRESQVAGMLDTLTLRRKGRAEADAIRQQGQLARMEARGRATKAYFGAAASLANTGANYAGG